MSRKAYTVKVFGSVQGVFYRANAKNMAEKLNLAGFAQNLADGSVLIEVEGEEHQLKQFISWCQEGSPQAEVADIEIKASEPQNLESFEIR